MVKVTCPKCGLDWTVGEPAQSGLVLQSHEGKSVCRARVAEQDAKTRGMVVRNDWAKGYGIPRGYDIPEEVAVYIRDAGLMEELETNTRRSRTFMRVQGDMKDIDREEPVREEWYPIWAVDAVNQALDSGDDPAQALLVYRQALREVPDFANSMLGDPRLLDGKDQ